MKKIIKPAEKEEAAYYSDFTGKPLGEDSPPVEMSINFNYGSKYDLYSIKLHLDDTDIFSLLEVISKKLCSDKKEEYRKQLEQLDSKHEDSVDSRSWDEATIYDNDRELLKILLGIDKYKGESKL